MSDLDLSDSRSVAQLQGLPLCMLANGSLIDFKARVPSPTSQLTYVLTEEEFGVLSKHPSAILFWKVCVDALTADHINSKWYRAID